MNAHSLQTLPVPPRDAAALPAAAAEGLAEQLEGKADDVAAAPPDAAGSSSGTGTHDTGHRAEPPATRRELERALRALGFSRTRAAAISSRGFDAPDGPDSPPAPVPSPPALPDTSALAAALERLRSAIED